jgi:hypothetical protein
LECLTCHIYVLVVEGTIIFVIFVIAVVIVIDKERSDRLTEGVVSRLASPVSSVRLSL